MLPVKPYNIKKLRRLARFTHVIWDLFCERDDQLEVMFLKAQTSPFLKMELTTTYGVREPEIMDNTIRQALMLGEECFGPYIQEILFEHNPDMYIAALGRYFHTTSILADDNYLNGYDFRLSVLSDVIRVMMGDDRMHSRDEIVETYLNLLPLKMTHHKGIQKYFSEYVFDRPIRKAS